MISSLLGLCIFCYTVYYAIMNSDAEKFTGFYNQTAFILLLFAPIGIVFISRNVIDFLFALKAILNMSFVNLSGEMRKIANLLASLSQDIRVNGMGVLARRKNEIKNPLFRDGIVLILNSFTPEEIKHNLIAKINTEQARWAQASSLFEALGKLSPAMGLLGTLVGLVQMLSNLSDPSKIGPGMAVSLLATLYGLIFGNAIYLPLADKIENHMEKKLHLDTMIMEGILLLKEKKSGAYVSGMVSAYSKDKGMVPKTTVNNEVSDTQQAKTGT